MNDDHAGSEEREPQTSLLQYKSRDIAECYFVAMVDAVTMMYHRAPGVVTVQYSDAPSGSSVFGVQFRGGALRCTVDDNWIVVEDFDHFWRVERVERERLAEWLPFPIIENAVARLLARLAKQGL